MDFDSLVNSLYEKIDQGILSASIVENGRVLAEKINSDFKATLPKHDFTQELIQLQVIVDLIMSNLRVGDGLKYVVIKQNYLDVYMALLKRVGGKPVASRLLVVVMSSTDYDMKRVEKELLGFVSDFERANG